MIPQQTFENYPVFGDNATKVAPDNAKYSAGFQQADVLPAEWMNWAWNKNTKGITALNTGLDSVEKEIINVLDAASVTPAQATNDQLLTSINYLITQAETRAKLAAHPVGSLYWSSQNTDPGTLFGGTWSRIKDAFVWAAGDSDTVNNTGGNKTVTLQTANLPDHHHSFTGSAVTSGGSSTDNTGSESSHTHGLSGTLNGNMFDEQHSSNQSSGNLKYAKTRNNPYSYAGTAYSTTMYSGDLALQGSTGKGTSHSHSMKHTHSVTAAGTATGILDTSNQSFTQTAVDKMPPYIVKYCWERTA